jgi:hypothetical protein
MKIAHPFLLTQDWPCLSGFRHRFLPPLYREEAGRALAQPSLPYQPEWTVNPLLATILPHYYCLLFHFALNVPLSAFLGMD